MDWSNFFSALLGGALTLAGQSYFTHQGNRRAELQASRQAAEAAGTEVRALAAHLRERGTQGIENAHAIVRIGEQARGHAIKISDQRVREELLWIIEALTGIDLIRYSLYHLPEMAIAWHLRGRSDNVVGAYIRDEQYPLRPQEIMSYATAFRDGEKQLERQDQMNVEAAKEDARRDDEPDQPD